MLKRVRKTRLGVGGGRFAIVAAEYNGRYVDSMLLAAKKVLTKAKAERIEVVRVPGSFEIPAVAAKLAHTWVPPLSAIICFGVIFQGETSHAQHIGDAVSHALAQIQVKYRMPVIHGVFVFQNEDQARVRCLGTKHNRGTEAARTALEMARVIERLESCEF
jgi:6,7-dimethyl-8-ribityllumazine synthase